MEASHTESQEPEVDPAARPDDDAGPAVEPTEGSQGESLPEDSGSFNPDAAVRTSALPPEAQSGVPPLPENAGVEADPDVAGPVAGGGQSAGGSHPEASQTDNAEEGTVPEAQPEVEGEKPEGDPGDE